jgi:hypothetical protein
MTASPSSLSRRWAPHVRAGMGLVLVLSLGACRPTAGTSTVTPAGGSDAPDEGADPIGRDEGDNVGDLRARLDRLRLDHEQLSSQEGGFGQCEDLCDLASKICSVKESLCEIAEDHPGDDAYQGLCREAQHECREAGESCVRCAENSGGTVGPPPKK